jgi:hypothetical protein
VCEASKVVSGTVTRTGEGRNYIYTVLYPITEMFGYERVSDFGIPILYNFIMHIQIHKSNNEKNYNFICNAT